MQMYENQGKIHDSDRSDGENSTTPTSEQSIGYDSFPFFVFLSIKVTTLNRGDNYEPGSA